jgi:hypothetical protein
MSPLLTLPAVDGVEITTIMDNSLDLLMSSTPLARRSRCRNMASRVLSYAQSMASRC